MNGVKICTISVLFVITHNMAPFSHFLAYYTRENYEAVADSVLFNVAPSFRNKVKYFDMGM